MAPAEGNSKRESPTGGQANSTGMHVQTLVALYHALLGPSPCKWLTMEPNVGEEKFDLLWEANDGRHAVQVKHSINNFSLAEVKKLTAAMKAKQYVQDPAGNWKCELVLVGSFFAESVRKLGRMNGVVITPLQPDIRMLSEATAHRLLKFLHNEKLQAVSAEDMEDLVAMLAWRLHEASCKGETIDGSFVKERAHSWFIAKPDSAKGSRAAETPGEDRQPRISKRFFGREEDLLKLDDAWNLRTTTVLSFVGLGGAGKTTLVEKWLERLEANADHGAYAIYKYSFYNQSAPQGRFSQEGQVSALLFLREALRFFGDQNPDDEGSLENKGERLAALIQAHRTLLFLDGLETLQHKDKENLGTLQDQGIRRLLVSLAKLNPGLCIITTRLEVRDLSEYPGVRQEILGNLSLKAGCDLLRKLGVSGHIRDIEQAVNEYEGHALALTLVGRLLAKYYQGNIFRRDQIPPSAYEREDGGHARRIMEFYESILHGRPALALLYILGLFDRPASIEAINAVINPATIRGHNPGRFLLAGIRTINSNSTAGLHNDSAHVSGEATTTMERFSQWKIKSRIGLTNAVRWASSYWAFRKMTAPLRHLTEVELEKVIYELRLHRLIEKPGSNEPGTIDCHPFVRMHFGEALRRKNRFVWQEAHSRLFEHYRSIAPDYPETITEMEPLYAAVAHGCQAGRYLEAGLAVYLPRMLRGGVYSVNTLGLLARDLAMLTYFFEKQWEQPARGLSEKEKATILYWAGTLLTTLSRYDEGHRALVDAKRLYVKLESWKGASASARYISELQAGFGNLKVGLKEANDSVQFADLIQNDYERVGSHAIMGHCLHQLGQWTDALGEFRAAEEALHRVDPKTESLHSFWGYLYCELLLDLGRLSEVEQRAAMALKLAADQRMFAMGKLLDAAIAELTLARAHLLIEQKSGSIDYRSTSEHFGKAMDGIRRVGHQWLVPQALFTGVEYQRLSGDVKKGAKFLGEARTLIFQSGRVTLKLYEADCLLSSVALYLRQQNIDNARTDLAWAEEVVASTGYHRRKVQLHLYHARLCQLEGALDVAHHHLGKAKEIVKLHGCHRWDFEISEIEFLLK